MQKIRKWNGVANTMQQIPKPKPKPKPEHMCFSLASVSFVRPTCYTLCIYYLRFSSQTNLKLTKMDSFSWWNFCVSSDLWICYATEKEKKPDQFSCHCSVCWEIGSSFLFVFVSFAVHSQSVKILTKTAHTHTSTAWYHKS